MGKIILTELQLKRLLKNIIVEKSDGDVKLRKLTFKSKWDFNPKHQGIRIEDVWKEYPSSILWAYLNLEKISFVDEVLDKLQEKYPMLNRIDKPGIDKEQYYKIIDFKNPFLNKTYEELKKIMVAKRLNGERPSKMLINVFVRKRRQHKMDKYKSENPNRNVERKITSALRNQGHSIDLDPNVKLKNGDTSDLPPIVFPTSVKDKD